MLGIVSQKIVAGRYSERAHFLFLLISCFSPGEVTYTPGTSRSEEETMSQFLLMYQVITNFPVT